MKEEKKMNDQQMVSGELTDELLDDVNGGMCTIGVSVTSTGKRGTAKKKNSKSSGKKAELQTMEYDSGKVKSELNIGVYSGGPVSFTKC